ncbi:efflux RND transporter periplasmic adaptor subunit [Bernardetia sp.]|uniref:efflux RND transporter periplasmic adaptor subunit n=1 Tax=Bernardetia sp. TaxID=1937974 RepID=UPI0025C09499|nr:efflux RND transporter periplasmic adaptor subunit [Bernardetia sp.]
MKKIFLVLFVLILIGMGAFVVYYFLNQNEEVEENIELVSPRKDSIIKKTVATGSIVPLKEVAVKPAVSGIIDKIFFEAGQEVKVGDVIAKIKVIPNMTNLTNVQNNLEQAKITLEMREREMKRQKQLFDDGVIAEREYMLAKDDYDLAKNQVSAAAESLIIVREGTSSRSSSTLTLVKATTSGVILDVPVKEGANVIESNTFNEGTTIATIADLNNMIFEGMVDEAEVGKLKKGMDLVLTIGAIDNEKFDAELDFIAPKGIEEEGAIKFPIKADVQLKENQFIRAGYSANADIVLERKDGVIVIEEAWLQSSNKKVETQKNNETKETSKDSTQTENKGSNSNQETDAMYVEVQTGDNVFEKRYLTLGLSDGINIEVVKGLNVNDKIKKPQ